MTTHLLLALSSALACNLLVMLNVGTDSALLFAIYASLLVAGASLSVASMKLLPIGGDAADAEQQRSSLWFPAAALLYALSLAVAVTYSFLPDMVLEQALGMGLLSVGYFVARAAMRVGISWPALWSVSRLVGAALAALAIVETLVTGERAYTVQLDPNLLAGIFNVFALTSFAALAQQLRLNGVSRSALPRLAVLLLFTVAVGATGSLSGLLCLFAALLPLSLFAVRGLTVRRARGVLLAALISITMVLLCSGGSRETPTDKLQGIATHSSFTVRVEMARSSLAIYRDSPWYGAGLGSYKILYPKYRHPSDTATSGDLAHNDYVQFLQEGGPLLLGSLLLIGLIVLARTGTLIFNNWRRGPAEIDLMQVGIGFALLALLLQAGMNFVFYSAPIALLFGLLLAGLAPRPQRQAKPASSGQVLVMASALLALSVGVSATLGARGLFLALTEETCERHACLTLRSNVEFVRKLTAYLAGTQETFFPARAYLIAKALRTEESLQDPVEKLKWRTTALRETLQVIEDIPALTSTYLTLVEILKREPSFAAQLPKSLPSNAAGLYRIALSHNPMDLQIRLNLVQALTETGKQAEALETLLVVMTHWKHGPWGDAGRMRILVTAIPLAVSQKSCAEAREMAGGLSVFVRLQKEALQKGAPLTAPTGITIPTPEESEKVLVLAQSCV